jgi:WD40 repeat protein
MWSPRGQMLLATTESNAFHVWDTRNFSHSRVWKTTSPVKSAAWSPDGTMLLVAYEKGRLIRDGHHSVNVLVKEPKLSTVSLEQTPLETKVTIDVSPDSELPGVCRAVIHDACRCRSAARLENPAGGPVDRVCWSPGGERLAVSFQEGQPG